MKYIVVIIVRNIIMLSIEYDVINRGF